MATKEQERKALEQIKKIVDGLGAESYLSIAFEGCFEDAAENIENDFALSMKDRFESEQKNARDLQAEVDKLKADLQKEKEVSEAIAKAAQKTEEAKSSLVDNLNDRIKELKEKVADLLDRESDLVVLRDDALNRVKEAEGEIIRLKAELYDYMVKERGVK